MRRVFAAALGPHFLEVKRRHAVSTPAATQADALR